MDVLIFQVGFSPCLSFCLEALRTYSPRSRVVVIGADIPDVPFLDETRFWDRWRQLEPLYEHFSPNSPDFEKRCLRRWLVAAEYARTTDVESYVCIDNDLLIFADLEDALRSDTPSDFYAGHACMAWVRERQGMERLAEHMLWLYGTKDSDAWRAMVADYQSHLRAVVGDMSIMRWFMGNRPDLGLTSPIGRSDVFDRNICETHLFMADGDRKRICFWDGRPYAMTEDRRIVRMNSLHLWGEYKTDIAEIWDMARRSVGKPYPVPWK